MALRGNKGKQAYLSFRLQWNVEQVKEFAIAIGLGAELKCCRRVGDSENFVMIGDIFLLGLAEFELAFRNVIFR